MSEKTNDILQAAAARKKSAGLEYAGALLPRETAEWLNAEPSAVLVDVRTAPELAYVGRVPGAATVEWQSWPDMNLNPHFLDELEKAADKNAPVFFLCRSGARSHYAAEAAAKAGWKLAFNVLEGFEGEINGEGKRGQTNGWRFCGLPWAQS